MISTRIALLLSGSVLFMVSTSMALVPLQPDEMQACTGGNVVNEQIEVLEKDCHYGGVSACEGQTCAAYALHYDSCYQIDAWLASGDDCRHVTGEDEMGQLCTEVVGGTVHVRGYAPEQKWGACDLPSEHTCAQTSIVCATAFAYPSLQDCGNEEGATQIDIRRCGCDLGAWEEAPQS